MAEPAAARAGGADAAEIPGSADVAIKAEPGATGGDSPPLKRAKVEPGAEPSDDVKKELFPAAGTKPTTQDGLRKLEIVTDFEEIVQIRQVPGKNRYERQVRGVLRSRFPCYTTCSQGTVGRALLSDCFVSRTRYLRVGVNGNPLLRRLPMDGGHSQTASSFACSEALLK